MNLFVKLLFLALIFSNQGCQIYFLKQDESLAPTSAVEIQPLRFDNTTSPSTDTTPIYKNNLYSLLMQGMQYQELPQSEQQEKCKTLKNNYREQSDWKIAWLLIHGLNRNFSCLNEAQSLALLNEMQALPDVNKQLQWLNNNHIKLLDEIVALNKSKDELEIQLKESKMKLKNESRKIEELKKIESNINKKIDNE